MTAAVCPVIKLAVMLTASPVRYSADREWLEHKAQCMENACAWWDQISGECAVQSIAHHFSRGDYFDEVGYR